MLINAMLIKWNKRFPQVVNKINASSFEDTFTTYDFCVAYYKSSEYVLLSEEGISALG